MISTAPGGRIAFQFHARDVNLVMGPATRGTPSPTASSSTAARSGTRTGPTCPPDGSGIAGQQRTYQLIRQPGPITERRFEIVFAEAGIEAYCFTFG